MGKTQKIKRKREEVQQEVQSPPPAVRQSDEPLEKKRKWVNKQRVLIFASRGINHRDRHLMEDLKKLMPHHKPESKMERSKTLSVINEMCEMKNCNKAIMFEGRKKKDLYMWLSNVPNGPSVKFFVENIYTMEELKLTGNCLRGSRPLLSFDPVFTEKPQYALLKEILTQTFGIPKHHPKSQPFFDHVYTFTVLDNRIWFRNFQILSEDGALAEVGPRFVLNPVKIFSGSFGGVALWENSNYVSPAKYRNQVRLSAKYKYVNRIQQKVDAEATRPTESYKMKPHDDIFQGNPLEKAQEYGKKEAEILAHVESKPTKVQVGKKFKKKKKKTISTSVENGTGPSLKSKPSKVQVDKKSKKKNKNTISMSIENGTGPRSPLEKVKKTKNGGNEHSVKKNKVSVGKVKNKFPKKVKTGKKTLKVKINGLAKKSSKMG